MRYYTTGILSENRRRTPEGYLLCLSVPIARTGAQEYAPRELPDLTPGADGRLRIWRDAEILFAPEVMASFEGKPVTLNHPESGVTPANWRKVAVGVAQNLRRGEGAEADLLLADLLITDTEAVALVEAGALAQISCGYDAEYEETAPGEGRQRGIVGNHIALVRAGRCGPRCAVKDAPRGVSAFCTFNIKEECVTQAKKPGMWERFFSNPEVGRVMDNASARAVRDEDGPAEGNAERGDIHAKLDEILILLRGMAEGEGREPPEEGEGGAAPRNGEKTRTGDTRPGAADAALIAAAKSLAPGLAFRAGEPACLIKRASLRKAMRDAAVRRAAEACLRGSSVDGADCLTLDAAFAAASEVMRLRNSARTAGALAATGDAAPVGGFMTPARLNELNRQYRATL